PLVNNEWFIPFISVHPARGMIPLTVSVPEVIDNTPPSPRPHYRDFITNVRPSVPAPRIRLCLLQCLLLSVFPFTSRQMPRGLILAVLLDIGAAFRPSYRMPAISGCLFRQRSLPRHLIPAAR